jgi:hypothetical protein
VLLAAGHLTGGFAELGSGRVQSPRSIQETTTLVSERDAMPVAMKKRQSEFFLELMDVSSEWRLRDVEAFGGPGDAQRVSHGDEGLYVPKVHGGLILYRNRMT